MSKQIDSFVSYYNTRISTRTILGRSQNSTSKDCTQHEGNMGDGKSPRSFDSVGDLKDNGDDVFGSRNPTEDKSDGMPASNSKVGDCRGESAGVQGGEDMFKGMSAAKTNVVWDVGKMKYWRSRESASSDDAYITADYLVRFYSFKLYNTILLRYYTADIIY